MHKKVWYAPNKFESYGEEEIKAVEECLRDGWLAGFGKRKKNLKSEQRLFLVKKWVFFVNSGSSAILLALAALDLPKGSEVVTPACGFATTVAPILQLGLIPKFCDVELTTYVPAPWQVVSAVTHRTNVLLYQISLVTYPIGKVLDRFVREYIS